MNRRNFLKKIFPIAAGVITAPTLLETALCNKKYFFFKNGSSIKFDDHSLDALHYVDNNASAGRYLGFERPKSLMYIKNISVPNGF